MVIVFSDFFGNESLEELTDAFLHLRHNKHEVLLFNVMDKKHELDFDYPNKPTNFIDLETGKKVKLHPAGIKQAYHNQVNTALEELKLKCVQFKIGFVDVDIEKGLEKVLQEYLVKRQKII